jgi:hypothetical protein
MKARAGQKLGARTKTKVQSKPLSMSSVGTTSLESTETISSLPTLSLETPITSQLESLPEVDLITSKTTTNKEEEFPEGWSAPDYKRIPCVTCEHLTPIPIFSIGYKEYPEGEYKGRICFQCLDTIRYKHHRKIDEVHNLTIQEAKELLSKKVAATVDADNSKTTGEISQPEVSQVAEESSETIEETNDVSEDIQAN